MYVLTLRAFQYFELLHICYTEYLGQKTVEVNCITTSNRHLHVAQVTKLDCLALGFRLLAGTAINGQLLAGTAMTSRHREVFSSGHHRVTVAAS